LALGKCTPPASSKEASLHTSSYVLNPWAHQCTYLPFYSSHFQFGKFAVFPFAYCHGLQLSFKKCLGNNLLLINQLSWDSLSTPMYIMPWAGSIFLELMLMVARAINIMWDLWLIRILTQDLSYF
jgi:hypothetical protein